MREICILIGAQHSTRTARNGPAILVVRRSVDRCRGSCPQDWIADGGRDDVCKEGGCLEPRRSKLTCYRRAQTGLAFLHSTNYLQRMSQDSNAAPGSHQLAPSADGDFSAALNNRLDGWNAAMGLRYLRATPDEVIAELEVGPRHRQAYGIVHGGVYSGIIETVASVAAALWGARNNQTVVGLENHTSFLNAVREGKLRVTARPLMRGRRTQVWAAEVTDAAGRLAADGKVRFLALEAGAAIAGETVRVKPSQG